MQLQRLEYGAFKHQKGHKSTIKKFVLLSVWLRHCISNLLKSYDKFAWRTDWNLSYYLLNDSLVNRLMCGHTNCCSAKVCGWYSVILIGICLIMSFIWGWKLIPLMFKSFSRICNGQWTIFSYKKFTNVTAPFVNIIQIGFMNHINRFIWLKRTICSQIKHCCVSHDLSNLSNFS